MYFSRVKTYMKGREIIRNTPDIRQDGSIKKLKKTANIQGLPEPISLIIFLLTIGADAAAIIATIRSTIIISISENPGLFIFPLFQNKSTICRTIFCPY